MYSMFVLVLYIDKELQNSILRLVIILIVTYFTYLTN